MTKFINFDYVNGYNTWSIAPFCFFSLDHAIIVNAKKSLAIENCF